MGKQIQEHVEDGAATSLCWRCYSVAALLVMVLVSPASLFDTAIILLLLLSQYCPFCFSGKTCGGESFYCGWRKEMRCEILEVWSSRMAERKGIQLTLTGMFFVALPCVANVKYWNKLCSK
jgi:hypothetical protein